MENTGALLIVGAWGSGKTYYIDNEVFKKLGEGDEPRQCIRVSLFGVKDTSEIPYRVFQAYMDLRIKDKTKGVVNLNKVKDWVSGVVQSIPKLKDIVDLSPLFTKGSAAYSLVPNSTIICFDDIERATEALDINEILGAVNELVENRHYKVLLIANKEYIDNKFQTAQSKSDKDAEEPDKQKAPQEPVKTEKELFYEKVVEKTIVFEPDILAIYKELVSKYNDAAFTAFMLKKGQQDVVDPDKTKNKSYKKQLQNIRTLKFSIEHFNQLWKLVDTKKVEDETSLNYRKLHNYWLFTHAVSMEQKIDQLKYEDDRGLSQTANIVERIMLDEPEPILFEMDDEEEKIEAADTDYVDRFKKRHFARFEEVFVFYKSIYDFITASKPLDIASIDKRAEETFNVKNGAINDASEILNTLLTKGFWTYTNVEAPQKLSILFSVIEKGEFNDYVSYYNAALFLFWFKQLILKTDKEIKDAISKGLGILSQRIPEVSFITQTQVGMLPADEANGKWVKQEIQKCVEKRLQDDQRNDIEELNHLFETDINAFTARFFGGNGNAIMYFQTPVLDKLDQKRVEERVQHLEPSEVMQLHSFIGLRYGNAFNANNTKELPFLEAISKGIESLDLEKALMSNQLVVKYLKPCLEKAIERINKIKRNKKDDNMNYTIHTPSGARVKKEIVDNNNYTAEMQDI